MPYLSELKIQEATIVRKVRRLPLPGDIKVQPGDHVSPDQEVARTELLPGEPSVVDIAKALGVAPDAIREHVLVQVGETVKREQIIARKTGGLLGSGDAICVSPCDGVVEHVSEAYGHVLIREAGDPVNAEITVDLTAKLGMAAIFQSIELHVKPGDEIQLGRPIAYVDGGAGWITAPVSGTIEAIDGNRIRIRKAYKPAVVTAYIPGTVVAVNPGESVTIETPAALIQGIFGIGGEFHGELVAAVNGPDDVLKPEHIKPEMKGKVVLGGAFAGYEALNAALRHDVVAVITGGARSADLSRLAGHDVGVGVTGNEEIGMAVILTEGFGSLRMAERTWNLLKSHSGDICSVNGASQIRAGVIRPEIIIPLAGARPSAPVIRRKVNLEPGMTVRVIRDPYFGLWGRIVSLPGEPVLLETGGRLPVLKVELEDGRVVDVLDTNVELFPETAGGGHGSSLAAGSVAGWEG